MKKKLSNGAIGRLYWGVFKDGTEEQVVRWDMRKDKVISTARRLMRANGKLKLIIRSKWFVTPPKETAVEKPEVAS